MHFMRDKYLTSPPRPSRDEVVFMPKAIATTTIARKQDEYAQRSLHPYGAMPWA